MEFMHRIKFWIAILLTYSSIVFANDVSLWEKLDLYGMSMPEQKQSFERLLTRAGHKGHEVLNKKHQYADFPAALLQLVKITQEAFTIRSGSKERWQIEPPKWLKQEQEAILYDVRTIGLIDEKKPTLKSSDVLCILGATKTRMAMRIRFAEALIQDHAVHQKVVILLTGERYVTTEKEVDGPMSELVALAKQLHKNLDKLTEADLMRDLFRQSKIFSNVESFVIDTPRMDLPRPTTETTVADLIKWLNNHPDLRNVTFISNQPYVGYQMAVIKEVFSQHSQPIEFEVVGCAHELDATKKAESLLEPIEALGSQIWAQTPWVLDTLNLKISNPDVREEFIKVYKKQPLIFRHIEKLFNK